MTDDEVRELLKRKVEEAGSQKAFCHISGVAGVDNQMVSRVLRGKAKRLPRVILMALGLKVAYEPIDK